MILVQFFAIIATILTQQRPDVRVRDLEAHPFCEQLGSVGDDLIGDPPRSLWNTIIGEGQAGCASNATLVVARMEGPKGKYLRDVRVVLSARYKPSGHQRETVVADTVPLGIPDSDGFLYAALWVPRTGCSKVDLRAIILGAAQPSVRQEVIPFECGE